MKQYVISAQPLIFGCHLIKVFEGLLVVSTMLALPCQFPFYESLLQTSGFSKLEFEYVKAV